MTGSTGVRGAGETATEILREVAAIEEGRVADLPALYDVVDPEAVDRLARAEGVRIRFRYCGHEVVIAGGEVSIDP